eukprot:TRINITY_DN67115_c0_g1_i1.p3 TRINITY_DN67115_c0_g1~~TRINITY_DN67115_c0_g1_i1.p3  ORF type:complete len:148 (-),score=50.01 TRINITY_DN67115_c0_g1_i1:90-533(-)
MDPLSMPAMPAPAEANPFAGMSADPSGGVSPDSNALREWERKHESDLEETARKEAANKEERRKAAAAELQKWNDERSESDKKRMTTNRADEKQAEAAKAEAMKPDANPWERVADLIDTSAKTAESGSDVSRMRNLLIQLKSSPVAVA